MARPHEELHQLRDRLTIIHDGIERFTPPPTKIPILDVSVDVTDAEDDPWLQQDHIVGLKVLKESIYRDLVILEKFLGDPQSANLPPLSTNAPYLISVWNQLLLAPQPVIAVFKTIHFDPQDKLNRVTSQRSSLKPPGAKVDVIAANGKQWFRINTIKTSRFMAELREIDSYMTDSSDDENNANARPNLAQTEFDNSVLRMGRDLRRAAEANPIDGSSEIPSVTIRLTRLASGGEKNDDPRIAQTIRILREMGITVEMGEQETREIPLAIEVSMSPLLPPTPTLNINLDLSILIALVSDLTHSALPKDVDEAHSRFIPPKRYREWKKQRNQSSKKPKDPTEPAWEDDEQAPTDVGKHSRALTNQVLQEMGKGLIQDMHDRLSALSPNLDNIHCWTTPEARDRALRIVGKIGGSKEQIRIRGMFPSDDTSPLEAEEIYWAQSRYPRNFIPLLPIRILPTNAPTSPDLYPQTPHDQLSPFFQSLDLTCQYILEQELVAHPRAFFEDGTQNTEIQRAMVTKVNQRLTAHTVQSMLWGAKLGWTTLTANKASVKAILKEIRLCRLAGRLDRVEESDLPDRIAALWLCDPKSLGEQMRSDEDREET